MLLWGPDSGSQACGDVGPGRMLDPLDIVDLANAHFSAPQDLQHLQVMITAGPTREALDPVRFISNHSSGKMGFAIARAAAARGAGDADRRAGQPADAAIGHPSGRHQCAGDGAGGATARRAAADFHLLRRRGRLPPRADRR